LPGPGIAEKKRNHGKAKMPCPAELMLFLYRRGLSPMVQIRRRTDGGGYERPGAADREGRKKHALAYATINRKTEKQRKRNKKIATGHA